MIAATYTQGGEFAIADVPVPEIANDEVLLRVVSTSICGTDTKIIRNGHRKLAAGQKIVLGHEFAGVIEKAGSEVKGLREGLRVGVAPNWGCGQCPACRRGMANYCAEYSAFGINTDGSHSEYVRIPAAVIEQGNVIPLAGDFSWEASSLAEPLSCVLGGQTAISLGGGDSVVIFGAGPMGLLHVLAASAAGAEKIIAVDLNAGRLDAARKAGATHTLHNGEEDLEECIREWTDGVGVDAAITAVPVPELVPRAFGLLANFGRLCLFAGLPKDRNMLALDGNAIHYRNIVITGTTGGCNADYAKAIDLIGTGKVDVTQIISHRFPISSLQEAYDVALAGQGMKIVLSSN
jgi:threonine dehydrogenase-like Zn-dependent dehydrogenase